MKEQSYYSSNNRYTTLNNITTLQEQTAPLPYETIADGLWTTEGTWKHGDVWDIETIPNNNGSIVRINNKVTTSANHKHLALIIEENQSLTVTSDKEINNYWYLELNGTLDLLYDSQLTQSSTSDLVTSANGKDKEDKKDHQTYIGIPDNNYYLSVSILSDTFDR